MKRQIFEHLAQWRRRTQSADVLMALKKLSRDGATHDGTMKPPRRRSLAGPLRTTVANPALLQPLPGATRATEAPQKNGKRRRR